MNRRRLLTSTLAASGAMLLPASLMHQKSLLAADQASSELPSMTVTLLDDGFEIDNPLAAGRFEVTVANAGTSFESHIGFGLVPDRVTDDQWETWLTGPDDHPEILTFEEIAFVGMPDWAQPGKSSTGVIDLQPGRYFLFDPFDARGYLTIQVEGDFGDPVEPASDLTIILKEMAIELPEAAFTTTPKRWKIDNTGAMSHEVAVIPIVPEFTEADLQQLMSMPEDATPEPGTPEFVYAPSAGIGILGQQQTSWLDVTLEPGSYLAACMLPFSTGYPHVIDGMYRFFSVE